MDNKSIWDRARKPPVTALKQIMGGRLKGMTDINPQWRYEIMTEIFGPVGMGWNYRVVETWKESGTGEQVMIFAKVEVKYRHDNAWSEPIEGVGGSMLIAKEAGGLHSTDEAYKMAITDALSVALKMIGVGADIYMGRWDGSKYKDDGNSQSSRPQKEAPVQAATKVRADYPFRKAMDAEKQRLGEETYRALIDPYNSCLDMEGLSVEEKKAVVARLRSAVAKVAGIAVAPEPSQLPTDDDITF